MNCRECSPRKILPRRFSTQRRGSCLSLWARPLMIAEGPCLKVSRITRLGNSSTRVCARRICEPTAEDPSVIDAMLLVFQQLQHRAGDSLDADTMPPQV